MISDNELSRDEIRGREPRKSSSSSTEALSQEQAGALIHSLPQGWEIASARLVKAFRFPDFAEALKFVNRVGAIAEAQNHHPDILLHGWNQVRLSLWTHTVGGVSENDFILAAKIDEGDQV